MQTLNNDCTVEVARRIHSAWVAFSKHRRLLVNKASSLAVRFRALQKFVLPALTYNIGVLNMTQRHLQQIRAAENKMMSKILGANFAFPAFKAEDGDDFEDFPDDALGDHCWRIKFQAQRPQG